MHHTFLDVTTIWLFAFVLSPMFNDRCNSRDLKSVVAVTGICRAQRHLVLLYGVRLKLYATSSNSSVCTVYALRSVRRDFAY